MFHPTPSHIGDTVNKLTATATAILAYVAILSGAVLAAGPAHAAPAPAHTETATHHYLDYRLPNVEVTSQDFRDAIESYGVSTEGIDIIVTDFPLLNCGSAKSVNNNFTGGGCTFNGGTGHATIVLSPNANDHIMMHEYAHARYGVGECAAEYFSNTITQRVEWSYPACAKH